MDVQIYGAAAVSHHALKDHATESVHPEQLVLEVLEFMLDRQQLSFPVCQEGLCIGIVNFKQLNRFLTHQEDGGNLLFHKFNFTLESALHRLSSM